MQELKFTPEELKMAIMNSDVIGKGFFGTLFLYKDKLIKLDSRLYSLLKPNDISLSHRVIEMRYQWQQDSFNSEEQILELVKRQPNVKLTKLPLGIVTFKDVDSKFKDISPGIIIPYHKNHHNLELLPRDDYKKVLLILKKLLEAVRELADQKIAQEDFAQYSKYNPNEVKYYNVMYKNSTPQIIDMSGAFVKVGKDFTDAKIMYNGLGNLVLDYFYFNKIPFPFERDSIEQDWQIEQMIKELETSTKKK